MIAYLAGTYSRPYVTNPVVNLYLCAPHSEQSHIRDSGIYVRGGFTDEEMKLHLAGISAGNHNEWSKNKDAPERLAAIFELYPKMFILESFFYVTDWMRVYIERYWDFMIDSGAFTFMESNKKASVNWDDYVIRYAEFIKDCNIEHFLELDIDAIAGLKEVERLRRLLEKKVGRQCIPVWHVSRGQKYWQKMIRDYDYVAVGGIVAGEITKAQYPGFTILLNSAAEQSTKVHGLGFTNLTGLMKPFYSVDSTAWLYGNRGGFLYRFNGRSIEKYNTPPDHRLHAKEAAIHNFNEWLKFQRWAKDNL